MEAVSDTFLGFGPRWLVRTDLDQPGDVVTFYSYKGGTGRSMGLVNCAGLIASHIPEGSKPILMIDFDLEAPGLHRYLLPYLGQEDLQPRPGVLELFDSLSALIDERLDSLSNCSPSQQLDDISTFEVVSQFDLSPYIVQTSLNGLQMIVAGCFDETYDQRLANFDWHGLFSKAPALFRCVSARLSSEYSYTFIDSRTGLSDTSGICTMLLPNVLVAVFTPNSQSLTGIEHLVHRAIEYRDSAADARELRVYPLPSRVDNQVEHFRQVWRMGDPQHALFGNVTGYQPLFEAIFANECGNTAPGIPTRLNEYFDVVQVPHTSDYAFGERLCFVTSALSDSLSIRNAFEQFLPWIVTGAQPWERPAEVLLNLHALDWLDESGVTVAPDEATDWPVWFERLARVADNVEHSAILQHSALSADRRFDIGIAISLAHAYREDFKCALDWLRRAAIAYNDDVAPIVCAEAPLRLLGLWRYAPRTEKLESDAGTWLGELDHIMAQWRPLKRDRQTWLAELKQLSAHWRLPDLLLQIQIETDGEASESALATMSTLVQEKQRQYDFEGAIRLQQQLLEILQRTRSDADELTQKADRELKSLRARQEQHRGSRLPSISECRYSAFLSFSKDDDISWNSWVRCFGDELNLAVRSRVRGTKIPDVFYGENSPVIDSSLSVRIKERIADAFCLIIFVGDNYVNSEWCWHELQYFRELYGTEWRSRVYIVALTQPAIHAFMDSGHWREQLPGDLLYLDFSDEAYPDRPMSIYGESSRDNRRIVVSNQFWSRFVDLREDLAQKMRRGADVADARRVCIYILLDIDTQSSLEKVDRLLRDRWGRMIGNSALGHPPELDIRSLSGDTLPNLDDACGVVLLFGKIHPESLSAQIHLVESKINMRGAPPGLVVDLYQHQRAGDKPLPLGGWSALRLNVEASDQGHMLETETEKLDDFLNGVYRRHRWLCSETVKTHS